MNEIYITDNNISISEEIQKEWKKQLDQYGKIYLYAMSGFGKSTVAKAFAEKQFPEWIIISAEEEDFWARAEDYLIKSQKTKIKELLILDDLQWLRKEEEQEKLVELLAGLNIKKSKLQCMLLSRAPFPSYLKPFYLTKQLAVENKDSLWLNEQQILEMIRNENLSIDENTQKNMAKRCVEINKGYPLAVCSFIRQLKEGFRDFERLDKFVREDIYQYFDRTLFKKWSAVQKETVIKLAVYNNFNTDMAEYLLGDKVKKIINSIMLISSFFTFTPPDTYEINYFFLDYLRKKQQELPKEERILLYYNAGQYYEKVRELKHALRCYKEAGQNEKIAEVVIYLSENVDGDFAKTSEGYLNDLPIDMEDRFPKLLGAKVMLCSYQMKVEESNRYLEKLKGKADEEKKNGIIGDALEAYVRTLLSLPHGTSEEMKDKLSYFSEYMLKYGIHLKNIIPTGNMPSVVNGGLDFLSWEKNSKILYPIMKKAIETVIGKEAVGIADICMGENLYEKNKRTEAMAYLTKGLSDANYKGSVRAQYAAIGVMARIFQSEEQADTAEGTLINICDKAEEMRFFELLPNIRASIVYCAMLKGETDKITEWLEDYAPDEHKPFYITDRYKLITKARAYVIIGRYIEALYILDLLEEYTKLYNRKYLNIEVNLLKAIILHRRGEEWQDLFLNTVSKAAGYSYVRILADQGTALLSLWKEIDWPRTNFKSVYIAAVSKELKKMAEYYPSYLKTQKSTEQLSPKEQGVLRLISEGLNNTEISKQLGISTATVKFHVSNILKKLKSENRTVAVKTAKEKELI